MAQFDLRGQKVNTQYIAGQDMYIGTAQNRELLAGGLEKLRQEFAQIKTNRELDPQKTTDVEQSLAQAHQEAKKAKPDKRAILHYLGLAKSVVENVATMSGFIPTLVNAIESVRRLI